MSNNLFRFVSIRPPKVFDEDWIISEDKIQSQVTTDVSNLEAAKIKAKKEVSRQQLLEEVGSQYQKSSKYYLNDKLFKTIRSNWRDINKLILSHAKKMDYGKFAAELAVLLAPLTLKPKVSSPLRDQSVKDLWDSLWLSYYTGIMKFNARPSDREEIGNWIKLFHLMSGADSADELRSMLDNWPRMRMSMPYDIFKDNSQPESYADISKDGQAMDTKRKAETTALDLKLSDLQTLERSLEDLIERKARKFRGAITQSKVIMPSKEKAASIAITLEEKKSDYMAMVPWMLSDQDLAGDKVLQQLLQKYRLKWFDGNAYALIDSIRMMVAQVTAERDGLHEKQTVITAGNMFQTKRSGT